MLSNTSYDCFILTVFMFQLPNSLHKLHVIMLPALAVCFLLKHLIFCILSVSFVQSGS